MKSSLRDFLIKFCTSVGILFFCLKETFYRFWQEYFLQENKRLKYPFRVIKFENGIYFHTSNKELKDNSFQ